MTGDRPSGLPDRARAWAQAHTSHSIIAVEPVGGGITGTKWVLRLTEGDPLVVRWSDPAVWGEVGREHVRREAWAGRLLAGSGLPVPQVVATDPDGSITGGSANLLTWQPGRVRLDRLSPAAVAAWAELALAVHRQPVRAADRPPTFAFRGPARPEVPTWSRRPELWRRAIAVVDAGPPPTAYGLVHGDFHLGNVLWRGDVVSGLVDWAESSWGPADLDVAHACCDLALLHTTGDAADFRTAYLDQGGRLDPDPDAARFWVVADIVGFLPDPAHVLPAWAADRPELTADDVRLRLECWLATMLG